MTAADTGLAVVQSLDAGRPTRKCPDCNGATQIVPDPDELYCCNERCGWSQMLKPAVTS